MNKIDEIIKICDEFGINNYTINCDGSLDVDGNVDLRAKGLFKLPLKFNTVQGNFYCDRNYLRNLEGSPEVVGKHFFCSENQLTTLKGSPLRVYRNYDCSRNRLKTLAYAPCHVFGTFYCDENVLTTLNNFSSKRYKCYYCINYPLEYKFKVFGNFNCDNNNLTNLDDVPRQLFRHNFTCYNNPVYEQLGDIDYSSYIRAMWREKKLQELEI